ncbi:MAG: tyrosine-type recombinase/integrase, partial [Desulfobulbaceae bacterium]|nr:tyrosine-type recombinase/integrase [Desulfobulbaceae bacterium]
MMTEDIFTNKDFLSREPQFFESCPERTFSEPWFDTFKSGGVASQRRQAFHRWCSRAEASGFAGTELLVEYLYGKYIKNLSVHTIRQSCSIVLSFLKFLDRKHQTIYTLTHQDIGAFVEFEQDRGLKTVSIIHHLEMVNAFIAFLVEQEILPHDIKQHKIKLKKPDVLPRAIPNEDIQLFLKVICVIRDRALLLLLLRTGMRIGELLNVKISDIISSEQKILIYQGEKNYQGRAVYYSKDAEQALYQWLQQRKKNSEYLFAGHTGMPLSYSTAKRIMCANLQHANLTDKNYTLHSLRHYAEFLTMPS